MKVSWIKYEKDKESFRLPQVLGLEVITLKDLEQTDETMRKLIQKHYDTIILSNEVAGFSQKINNEYIKMKNIDIIISRDKYYKL